MHRSTALLVEGAIERGRSGSTHSVPQPRGCSGGHMQTAAAGRAHWATDVHRPPDSRERELDCVEESTLTAFPAAGASDSA